MGDGGAAVLLGQLGLALGDGLAGVREQGDGLVGVRGHRGEGLHGVGRGEVREAVASRRDAGLDLTGAAIDLVEHLGSACLQVAQLVELLRLGVQRGGDLVAQGDDLRHHRARLRFALGGRVVELLAQGEGLADLLLAGRDHVLEVLGGLEPELRLREAELLLGGLHRVVDRDEGRARSPVQVLRGEHRGSSPVA